MPQKRLGSGWVQPPPSRGNSLDKDIQAELDALIRDPDQSKLAQYLEGLDGSSRSQVDDYINRTRADAFRRGEVLPGVGRNGEGIPGDYLSGDVKALGIQAQGQNAIADAAEGQDALTADDYTVNPTLDEGAGYDLVDRLTMFGDALPLDQQLQLEAIRQGRTDTTGLDAQRSALGHLDAITSGGGLTAIERARMAKSQALREAQGRAAEGAIRADAEEQGRAGGRMSMLLRNQAQQRATNQRAQDDLDTQALALGRMDSAIRAQGDLGGSVQTAQDVIDKFNTEDARAQRDAANEARTETWRENNRRESANVGVKNQGAGAQFAADTARSDANTQRINQGEYFNKGPSGGQRGLMRDKLAAAEAVAGNADAAAALRTGHERAEDANDAARYGAIASGVTGALGLGGDIATAGLKEAWEDDDEDD